MRTGSASQAPAAVPVAAAASDLSPNPVVPQVEDEVGVVADEPEDEFSVDFDQSGEEFDEHAIQALLDGIYDADSSAEEDAIAVR